MAAAPRKQNLTFTSARGVFNYPKLTEPDTKFKDEGEYSVNLILDASTTAAVKMMKQADEAAAESLAEAKANAKNAAEAKKWETKYLPYTMVEDSETGEETGEVKFKFTMKASGVSKKTGKPWSRKPVLFDARGQRITKDINVGGGSEGKVSYQVIPYAPTTTVGASVKFALEAVQIIELRSFGEKNADQFGFGQEEGFSADDIADDEGTDGEDQSDGSSSNDMDDEIPF